MTSKSILNMNWTVGQRELMSSGSLTKLEKLQVSVEVAYSMQNQKGYENIQIIGANKEAEVLHQLIEYCNSDPDHIRVSHPSPNLPGNVWRVSAKIIVRNNHDGTWTMNTGTVKTDEEIAEWYARWLNPAISDRGNYRQYDKFEPELG